MLKEDIIDLIIEALQNKNVLAGYHKFNGKNAVQIKQSDGTYFNIYMSEIRPIVNFIVKKLR
jgi:hypothetical protein